MFTKGQKVVCINDRFHGSLADWADHIPRRGCVYTIQRVVLSVPAVLTDALGPGLLLEELPNPGNKVCFSAWRFKPYDESEIERAMAEAFGLDWATRSLLPEPVEQPQLPVPVTASVRKEFAPAWTRPCVLLGWEHTLEPDSVTCLHALAQATESITFNYGYTLEPGQLLAELAMMRIIPAHWPSLGFAGAMLECRLLRRGEEYLFLNPDRRASFRRPWVKRLHQFSAKVLAHADAAGL